MSKKFLEQSLSIVAMDFKNWGEISAASFLKQLKKQWPNPVCELEFTNDFDCLIAIVLSAQTADKMVNKVTRELFKHGRSAENIANLTFENLQSLLNPIGLSVRKAHYVAKIAKILCDQTFPERPEELLAFPGVGWKTAQVFFALRRNMATYPVDAHIFRICNRTHFATGRVVNDIEHQLRRRISKKDANAFHLRMILHGRYICQSKRAQCHQCHLNAHCAFFKKNNQL